MKRTSLIIVLLSITLLLNAQQKNHRYAIKSGYVKYELKGNTKGVKELWWDNYGEKMRTLTKATSITKMFGIKNKEEVHKLEIINKNKYYNIDYIEDRKITGDMPYYGEVINMNMTEEEQKQFADKLLNSMGGERLGNEDVLGYSCEKITALGMTSWVYNGITLKIIGNVLGIKTDEIAVEFKPNMSISTSKFQPPAGVKFRNPMAEAEAQGQDNPFTALAQGLNQMQEEEQQETYEEKQDKLIPTKYPYNLFQKKINGFSYKGYTKTMTFELKDGAHIAMFMKGFSNNIIVAAVSRKNKTTNDIPKDKFRHNGKTCYYEVEKKDNGDESSTLIIEVPKYDTYIAISVSPVINKSEILKIADKFNF